MKWWPDPEPGVYELNGVAFRVSNAVNSAYRPYAHVLSCTGCDEFGMDRLEWIYVGRRWLNAIQELGRRIEGRDWCGRS